jgi:multisubunit Na+/H+ antiporter MnhE subunit
VRRAVSLLAWFALLEGLWAVFVGKGDGTELAAGLIAAALGALLAETLRSLGLLGQTADYRLLARVWKLPLHVVFDVGVVTWVLTRALVRGRRVRGRWVSVPFRTVGAWPRAFGATVGTASPNAVVVDVDGTQALMHVLDADAPTARSVL